MAPASSSLGTDQPWWCTPLVDDAGFPRCWGHWWPCPWPPGLHRALQAGWRLVLALLLACLLEQSLLGPVTHVVACGHPVLCNQPGVGTGSRPGNITRSLSWSLMAGTSCDVALELKASKMPCSDFVIKLWRGHQCGFQHPTGCWPIPCCTCPLFLPEAHLHQSPPITALLTALTYL